MAGSFVTLTGCAGYFIGASTLYRPDIYTVHVPIFESDSYRSFLGERLTEAVVKQIEQTTPYKVVADPFADSTLQGRVLYDSKYVILENRNDEPRDIEFKMGVEVVWRDRSGQIILGPEFIAMPRELLEIGQAVHFIPESGQSLATAQVLAIERLAEQIVAKMEVPW